MNKNLSYIYSVNHTIGLSVAKALRYLLIITLTFLLDFAVGQSSVPVTQVPDVFLIGEHEEHYMTFAKQHPALFMSVYNNDIDLAFRSWSNMLMDMEDYAAELNFDLKGVKLWINLYFNADGTIAHLAFFPKPNSRNIPTEHLTAFFKNFVRDYSLPVNAAKAFQHSASASFPTFFRDQPIAKKG
jgi:hypothetical protein